MTWEPFNLDEKAHDLVFQRHSLDLDATAKKQVYNQVHEMRQAVAYGLERFWGEQIRLLNSPKGDYWRDTWLVLCEVMELAEIELPRDRIDQNTDSETIRQISENLWNNFDNQQRQIALAILTQLCDNMVWWTQRYKKLI